jgi:zinc protease
MLQAIAIFALVAGATANPAPELDIPFEKLVLAENGLEVILSEDHALPIVAVNVWYHAGPINEAPGRTGFAHLFEHLMFQGSKHVGDDEHFRLLEAAGASMVNGTTDYDRTNYFATVPRNELALALWLEADRMGFLLDTLTQQKLDNQRDVVMNERRQSIENAPYGPSGEKLVQLLFPPQHPYFGYVMGSMKDLAAATLDDVRDFYRRYYSPANATLVIAGDFDPALAKALIKRYFGTLPRRDVPEKRAVPPVTTTGEQSATVVEPVAMPRIQLGWVSPPYFAPGDADCDVLAALLGDGRSSRLYRRLVYELQLAQEVNAFQESGALGSIFTITVVGRPGVDVAALERETEKVIDEVRATPPSERELTRARNGILTSFVSALQRLGGFGGRADMLNHYNQYVGDPGALARDLGRYRAVTPQSVFALARTLLVADKRAKVVTVPKP